MKWDIPLAEEIHPGNLGCQGCGGALAMRLALKALGPDTVAVIPACCWSIIDGAFPVHALQVPVFHTAFETAAVAASGIKAAKEVQGKGTSSGWNDIILRAASQEGGQGIPPAGVTLSGLS